MTSLCSGCREEVSLLPTKWRNAYTRRSTFSSCANSACLGFEELAAGAIASGGVRVLNEDVVRAIPYASEAIEAVTAKETAELQRREQIYREGRPAPELRDKIVILVDDGLATGATMRAAVKALRQRGAAKIVVAVPVGPPDTCEETCTGSR